MKILLLEHPRFFSDEHFNDVANAPLSACLSVGYTAAMLEKSGHDVAIYDAYDLEAGFKACLEALLQRNFDLLGVHAVYFWTHTPQLFLMLEKFSMLRPQVKIVLFGIFPTFAFDSILEQYPFIHAVIIGDPEITTTELACAFQNTPSRLNSIAGIAYRDTVQIRITAARHPAENLDGLPFPVRYKDSLNRIGGSILGSRGCHGSCAFCCINSFYGAGPARRCRSPENICREIEGLLPGLDNKYLYFLDADFFGPGSPDDRARVKQIIDCLLPFNVHFGFECRAGSFDEKLLSAMVKAGLKDVFLGIESASVAALKRMRKGISPSKCAASVKMLHSYGIEPNLGFIMFEPDSELADVRDNFSFLKSNGLLQKLDVTANVLYHREISLKGMPNFARLAAAGRLSGTDQFGYEGHYCFADPAVQFFGDLMSYICGRVLRATDNARSPICWKRGASAASQRVNDYIVNLFDETLQRLLLRDIPLELDGLLKIEDEALCAIEGLIVEERVCQS
jgi:anaerobic magnesium-protoporphyrin IX monomethyl ester cyclase